MRTWQEWYLHNLQNATFLGAEAAARSGCMVSGAGGDILPALMEANSPVACACGRCAVRQRGASVPSGKTNCFERCAFARSNLKHVVYALFGALYLTTFVSNSGQGSFAYPTVSRRRTCGMQYCRALQNSVGAMETRPKCDLRRNTVLSCVVVVSI